MKINAIELYSVAMPIVKPFETSFGRQTTFDGVFVKLKADGQYGWGESLSWKYPAYMPECASTQYIMCRDFIAPLLLGRTIESGEQLQQLLCGVRGNFFAKAGFDLAWWDLFAKKEQQPLWRLIGGTQPDVDVGADFGVKDTIQELLDDIGTAIQHGYKRIKLKAKPGWDLNMVKAVRQEFPEAVLHIDCNSAYTLADLPMFQELDAYNLAMFEQPLTYDDLLDHAKLQAAVKTPICLDESITSAAKARKAAEIKACQWVNIKLGRTGGLTQAIKIHHACRDHQIPCWVGGMGESAIGGAFNLALATLPNIKYPADIFPSARFYERDLGVPPMIHSSPSQFRPLERPGTGVEPDPELLAKFTVDHADIS